MESIRKKILLTGLVAVFAFLVTIGSTYAWFTMGVSSQVSNIEFTIDTDVSLMILMDEGYVYSEPGEDNTDLLNDPGEYGTVLNNIDITAYYDLTNIIMEPITTTDGENFTFRGGVAASPNDTNGVYYEFSVWLLSQDEDADVALKDLSLSASNGLTLKDNVINAVRLATESADDPTVNIYGIDKDYNFEFFANDNGFDALVPANNVINPTIETGLEALHEVFYLSSGLPTADESTDDLSAATTIVSLTADIPEKVTIRVWLEGWDNDTNNNVLEAIFDIQFSFVVKP